MGLNPVGAEEAVVKKKGLKKCSHIKMAAPLVLRFTAEALLS